MSKIRWPVRFRPDEPRRTGLYNTIASLRGDVQAEFWFAERKMERDRIHPADSVELLAQRYVTYAIDLGGGGPLLLADFDRQDGIWTLLDLIVPNDDRRLDRLVGGLNVDVLPPSDIVDRLFQECCTAHGLTSPSRQTI